MNKLKLTTKAQSSPALSLSAMEPLPEIFTSKGEGSSGKQWMHKWPKVNSDQDKYILKSSFGERK